MSTQLVLAVFILLFVFQKGLLSLWRDSPSFHLIIFEYLTYNEFQFILLQEQA